MSHDHNEIADPAMQPPIIDMKPGDQYADEHRDVNMVIGMDRTPGGRLWAAWVSGGDSEKGYFVIATSDDGGRSWSGPRMVIDPTRTSVGIPIRVLVGNFWTDPTGRLWLFFDQSMGFYDGRAGVWAITCDNPDADAPTWSAPRRIWHGATLNKPLALRDGTWLLPISLWRRNYIHAVTEKNRVTCDPALIPAGFTERYKELDEYRMANVFASTDQGATWQRRGGVTFPAFDFDEHMFVELRDGRLWMLARTRDGIHESFSADQARTWSEPAMRFPNVSARFFLRRLGSGRLLLIKHGRIDQRTETRSHLTAFCSEDDGRTWTGGLVIDQRTGVSYPDGFESPDGLIHIVYDRNRYTDAEILLARFRETDVLAGQFQSPDAGQRIIITRGKTCR